MGGTWKEDLPADFVVFRRFVPPFDESRPVPHEAYELYSLDGTALTPFVRDRDVASMWRPSVGISRGFGIEARLGPPRRVSALAVVVSLDESPLGVPWVAEVDGAVVTRGPLRHTLQWVNGAPRAGKQALLVVPLAGRAASSVRLIFQDAGPVLRVPEVFLYGPDETERPLAGAAAASRGLARARAGDWWGATAAYQGAVAAEPERASLHACLARALWRVQRRSRLDVESLDDGGPALVTPR
jgi:hypothetical protein